MHRKNYHGTLKVFRHDNQLLAELFDSSHIYLQTIESPTQQQFYCKSNTTIVSLTQQL
jgi:hypothetical protein